MLEIIFLMTGLLLLFFLTGRQFAGYRGIAIAFIAALSLTIILNRQYNNTLLNAYSARPAQGNHRLVEIAGEVVKNAGLPMPRLFIIPTETANILIPRDNAIAVTEGILSLLDDRELKGVIAHETGHEKNRDSLIRTAAASLSGGVMLLSLFALFFGGSRKLGWARTVALAVMAPVIAGAMTMAVSRLREYNTDEYAARLTEDPVALVSALRKLDAVCKSLPAGKVSYNPPHRLLSNIFLTAGKGELFSTHPPVEKRIERLEMLASRLRE